MSRICYLMSPYCSCNRFLGRIQYDFESLTSSKVSMADACTKLGFNLLCCRNFILNCPLYFILSTDTGRIIDRTGLINGQPDVDYYYNTPDIILTKAAPSFPALPGIIEFPDEDAPPFTLPTIPSVTDSKNDSVTIVPSQNFFTSGFQAQAPPMAGTILSSTSFQLQNQDTFTNAFQNQNAF